MEDPLRLHFLDASVIVKLILDEERSNVVRDYFKEQLLFCTTALCFGEALGVIKCKHKRKCSSKAYRDDVYYLAALIDDKRIDVVEHNCSEQSVLWRVEKIVKEHNIDSIDAHQLVVVQDVFTEYAEDLQKILVTADRPLARAGRAEGLAVWCVLDEDQPNF